MAKPGRSPFYFSARLLLGLLVLVIPWATGLAPVNPAAPLAIRLARPFLLSLYLAVFLLELWGWARARKVN